MTIPDFIDLQRSRFQIDTNAEEWEFRLADKGDYDKLFTGPVRLWEDGILIAVYIPEVQVEDWDIMALRRALHAIKCEKDYRVSGLKILSATFGYLSRVAIRRDFCTTAASAYDWPTAHAEVCRWAAVAEAYYFNVHPSLYEQHAGLTNEKVESAYHLDRGIFTSGIINRDSQLPYHFDRGNYKAVWSAMFGFKEGVTGGYLVLPEFRIAFQIRDTSLLMFDGQRVFHGVTALKFLADDATRHTVVYYSRQGMWNCDPPAVELKRIRDKRTAREYAR